MYPVIRYLDRCNLRYDILPMEYNIVPNSLKNFKIVSIIDEQ